MRSPGDKILKSHLEQITEENYNRVYKAKPENHVIFDDSSGHCWLVNRLRNV